jgi:hypothetical protein
MRDLPKNRPGFSRSGNKTDSGKDLCDAVMKLMAYETSRQIVTQIAERQEAFVQQNLYDFVRAMICVWAAKEDLSQEDACVIEDCRKICDVMGWMPEKM